MNLKKSFFTIEVNTETIQVLVQFWATFGERLYLQTRKDLVVEICNVVSSWHHPCTAKFGILTSNH